jgi:hypothetical protein
MVAAEIEQYVISPILPQGRLLRVFVVSEVFALIALLLLLLCFQSILRLNELLGSARAAAIAIGTFIVQSVFIPFNDDGYPKHFVLLLLLTSGPWVGLLLASLWLVKGKAAMFERRQSTGETKATAAAIASATELESAPERTSREAETERESAAEVTDAICPNCDKPIAVSSTQCPSCGANFSKGSAWRPIPRDA